MQMLIVTQRLCENGNCSEFSCFSWRKYMLEPHGDKQQALLYYLSDNWSPKLNGCVYGYFFFFTIRLVLVNDFVLYYGTKGKNFFWYVEETLKIDWCKSYTTCGNLERPLYSEDWSINRDHKQEERKKRLRI